MTRWNSLPVGDKQVLSVNWDWSSQTSLLPTYCIRVRIIAVSCRKVTDRHWLSADRRMPNTTNHTVFHSSILGLAANARTHSLFRRSSPYRQISVAVTTTPATLTTTITVCIAVMAVMVCTTMAITITTRTIMTPINRSRCGDFPLVGVNVWNGRMTISPFLPSWLINVTTWETGSTSR